MISYSSWGDDRDGIINKITGDYEKQRVKANLLLKLSFDFMDKSSEQSLKYAFDALEVATKAENNEAIAKAERYIGDDYVNQLNFPEGLKYLIKALDVCETAGLKKEEGSVYNDLGEFNNTLKQYKKALDFYNKGAAIFKGIKDKKYYYMSLSNIASAYQKLGNTAKSEEIARLSLKMALSTNDTLLIGDNYRTLGTVYLSRDAYDSSKASFDRAYYYYSKAHDEEAKLSILQNIGNIYLKKQDPLNAESYFQDVLNQAQKLRFSYLITSTYQSLSMVDSMTGNFPRALAYYKKYVQLNDSIETVEKAMEISKINAHRDLELKQKNIEKLTSERDRQAINIRFKNSIVLFFSVLLPLIGFLAMVLLYNYNQKKEINNQLSIQKEELQTLNTVKDRLFSIISHDLRSPLANLEAILKLMESGDLSNEEVMMLSSQLTHNVQETSYMLDNLLQWSKSQMRGINPKKDLVNLPELAREVVSFFNSQADKKAIDIRVSKTDTLTTMVDKEMIKLVIRNLVANAIKFTPSGGKIGINIRNDRGIILVSVSDSGIGIPDMVLEKLFTLEGISTSGTQNEKGTGLGLLLCKDFIEINQGKIWAESNPGMGSTFTFSLPLMVKPMVQDAILAKS